MADARMVAQSACNAFNAGQKAAYRGNPIGDDVNRPILEALTQANEHCKSTGFIVNTERGTIVGTCNPLGSDEAAPVDGVSIEDAKQSISDALSQAADHRIRTGFIANSPRGTIVGTVYPKSGGMDPPRAEKVHAVGTSLAIQNALKALDIPSLGQPASSRKTMSREKTAVDIDDAGLIMASTAQSSSIVPGPAVPAFVGSALDPVPAQAMMPPFLRPGLPPPPSALMQRPSQQANMQAFTRQTMRESILRKLKERSTGQPQLESQIIASPSKPSVMPASITNARSSLPLTRPPQAFQSSPQSLHGLRSQSPSFGPSAGSPRSSLPNSFGLSARSPRSSTNNLGISTQPPNPISLRPVPSVGSLADIPRDQMVQFPRAPLQSASSTSSITCMGTGQPYNARSSVQLQRSGAGPSQSMLQRRSLVPEVTPGSMTLGPGGSVNLPMPGGSLTTGPGGSMNLPPHSNVRDQLYKA